jgi:hypothetical protein
MTSCNWPWSFADATPHRQRAGARARAPSPPSPVISASHPGAGHRFKEPSSSDLTPQFLPFVNWGKTSRTLHHGPEGLLICTRAWKTAFANAPMKCGPQMAARTAKRSSTGLPPNGNCWGHRRQPSPARRRTHGRTHVRRSPARSRGLADACPDLTRVPAPVRRRSARKAAGTVADSPGDPLLRNPTMGMADPCASPRWEVTNRFSSLPATSVG